MDMKKKLHFHDVAIVPQPTELSSRSQVNLEVSYITKHSKREIRGCPVIVANMDTVGTFKMAKRNTLHSISC
jgi:GMP reductase